MESQDKSQTIAPIIYVIGLWPGLAIRILFYSPALSVDTNYRTMFWDNIGTVHRCSMTFIQAAREVVSPREWKLLSNTFLRCCLMLFSKGSLCYDCWLRGWNPEMRPYWLRDLSHTWAQGGFNIFKSVLMIEIKTRRCRLSKPFFALVNKSTNRRGNPTLHKTW